jgi:hypothetical protein
MTNHLYNYTYVVESLDIVRGLDLNSPQGVNPVVYLFGREIGS